MKNKKLLIFPLLMTLFSIFIVGLSLLQNKKFLDIFAERYFDQQYYLEKYPEVKNLKITPFEHYSNIGWLEEKNPNKDFDNNFYKRIYGSWDSSLRNLNPLQHFISCKMKFDKCYTHPNQLKKAESLKNPKYYLALVSIFRDEARFLKEWIEFHKLIGVEHFYLYNHLSKDNYMEVLEPYIKEGIVELKNLTTESKDWKHWNIIQVSAYNETINKTKDTVEWLLVIDSDEFVFPNQKNNLKEVLKDYNQYATLSFSYRNFGSGKVEKIKDNEIMIEQLIMAEKSGNLHTSPIVKPRYVKHFNIPHFPILEQGHYQITENFEYIYGPFSPYQSFNIIKANHYWGKDLKFFKESKLSRAHILEDKNLSKADILTQRDLKIKQIMNTNKERSSVLDDSILRFVPALRAKLFNQEESK